MKLFWLKKKLQYGLEKNKVDQFIEKGKLIESKGLNNRELDSIFKSNTYQLIISSKRYESLIQNIENKYTCNTCKDKDIFKVKYMIGDRYDSTLLNLDISEFID